MEEQRQLTPLELLLKAERDTELYKAMSRALTIRERQIINMRFGLNGPEMSLRVIGGYIGVTPERIRQIVITAVKKLRRGYKRKT